MLAQITMDSNFWTAAGTMVLAMVLVGDRFWGKNKGSRDQDSVRILSAHVAATSAQVADMAKGMQTLVMVSENQAKIQELRHDEVLRALDFKNHASHTSHER